MAAVLLIVAAIAGGYFIHVRVYPWKACPRCAGRRRNTSGIAHRDCGRCGATGRVRRLGAPRNRKL
jgi:DnaJ-class molecular chaperone